MNVKMKKKWTLIEDWEEICDDVVEVFIRGAVVGGGGGSTIG
jgi:hypothetical protein